MAEERLADRPPTLEHLIRLGLIFTLSRLQPSYVSPVSVFSRFLSAGRTVPR